MDYIREELLRQRNAWAALLRSGQRSEGEDFAEQSGAAVNGLAKSAEESGRANGQRGSKDILRTARRRLWPARQEHTARRRDGGVSEEMTAAGWAGGAEPADVTVRPGLQNLRPETAREQGAKELSRVIQRDSRRYDGGFALY